MEGEGSFYILKRDNFRLAFSLTQSVKDLALMEELKTFFNELSSSKSESVSNHNAVSLSIAKGRKNSSDAVQITISQNDFIANTLIPFFDGLI